MNRRGRTIGYLVLPLTFLAALCEEPQGGGVAGEELTSIEADVVNYGMHMYVTAHGVRSGEIQADTAYIFDDSTSVRVKAMRMSVFDELGSPEAIVEADSGRVDQSTEQMDAWGDVTVELAGRGCRITGSVIHYDPPGNRIYSNAPVRFEQGGSVTTGRSFSSDLTFDNISISFPVGPFNVCGSGGL